MSPWVLQASSWSMSEGQTVTLDPRTSAGQSASGLTYSVSGVFGIPPGLAMASDGRITGTVDYSAVLSGTSSYVATVTASHTGFSEKVTVTLAVANTPLLQAQTLTVSEGQSVSVDPRTTFGQSASGLTYSVSSGSLPPGM